MGNCNNHLYVISFTAGGDSGIALLAACSESEAIQLLRVNGKKKEVPETYSIVEIVDIGLSVATGSGLIIESYVNAVSVFREVIDKLTPSDNPDPSPAPSGGGEENVIEGVAVNGRRLVPRDKVVDVPVPTTVRSLSDSDDFVTNQALTGFATKVELQNALDNITVTGGGGQMNVIEKIKRNGVQINPGNDKDVNIIVPTALSDLSGTDNLADRTWVNDQIRSAIADLPSPSVQPTVNPLVPIVNTQVTNQISLSPNKYYVWPSISRLSFSLNTSEEQAGYVNTYAGEFTVSGVNFSLGIPDGIRVADKYYYDLLSNQYFQSGGKYQFSIVRGVMVIYSIPQN